MFHLHGKGVLLTGATGGIGSAIAEVFVAAGARVVLSSADNDRLHTLCNDLCSNVGSSVAFPIVCDLYDPEQLKMLYSSAEKLLNQVDVLICNAGIVRDNLAIRMKQKEWDDVLAIDLTSVFKLNQEAMKRMMRQKYGRIINISSIVSYTGNFGQANYAAAKAGMVGMSKSIAQEGATRNVTVNCIAPGFIDTPMTANLSDNVKDAILAKIPMGRMGTAREVAEVALFIASSSSSYITGSTIHVNGGMYML